MADLRLQAREQRWISFSMSERLDAYDLQTVDCDRASTTLMGNTNRCSRECGTEKKFLSIPPFLEP